MLSKTPFDKVSLELRTKIKQWGIESTAGTKLTETEVDKLSKFIENRIVEAMKKFSAQSQRKRRQRNIRRFQISKEKNNISRMKNFGTIDLKKLHLFQSQNELLKSEGLKNAKFSEGNRQRRGRRIQTNIDLEDSQISGVMDHMPLTRLNSKVSINRRKDQKLWSPGSEPTSMATSPCWRTRPSRKRS